jgi:hypothetical protein
MAGYYTYEEAAKSGEKRRQRLEDILAKKRQGMQQIHDEIQRGRGEEQRAGDTDWWSKAGTGGALGGMIGGLPGMAIGGGIGALLGMGKAAGTRMGEGQSPWSSILSTITDFDPLTSGRALPALLGPAAMLGKELQAPELPPGPDEWAPEGTQIPYDPKFHASTGRRRYG